MESKQKFDLKIYRPPQEDLIIGRFSEPIKKILSEAQDSIRMGFNDEKIEEDPQLLLEKKTFDYHERRKRRRYKNKTSLSIEEQGRRLRNGTGIDLTGNLLDTHKEGGLASKYVLLEYVQTGDRVESE